MKARGAAVVELVLWMSIFTAVLAGSFEMARLALWRLRLVSVARLSAQLVGSGRVASDVIDREAHLYFLALPGSDRAALDFSVRRFLGVPSAPFYKLMSTELRLRLANATLEESVRGEQEESS